MRVLVVDDSALMRRALSDILSSDPQIEVVGTARDGVDALKKVRELRPDVVTMDIEMPNMTGIEAVRHIMENNPTPVIMVSALTTSGAHETFEALDAGAVDYVLKPSGSISLDIARLREEIIERVKVASKAHLRRPKIQTRDVLKRTFTGREKAIVIGASTGGPSALSEVVSRLPENSPPIYIVQHMPPGFTSQFAKSLDKKSEVEVREAQDGDAAHKGLALLAPGDYHMLVTEDKHVRLNQEPKIHGVRPAVDPTMISAAGVYGENTIGVILTGMGRDGTNGIIAIKHMNGFTIAQDEESSVIYGMPKEAFETGSIDVVAPLSRIAREIIRRC